jgi:hypothetical protein
MAENLDIPGRQDLLGSEGVRSEPGRTAAELEPYGYRRLGSP